MGVTMAMVLGVAGCATSAAPPLASSRAIPAETGKILSARRVVQRNGGAEIGVLGALGTTAAIRPGPATEFIVERSNGGIMSVIQPDPTGLRVGEQVDILRGVVTRLVPVVAASPGGT